MLYNGKETRVYRLGPYHGKQLQTAGSSCYLDVASDAGQQWRQGAVPGLPTAPLPHVCRNQTGWSVND